MHENVAAATSADWLDQPFNQATADVWDLLNCNRHGVLKHVLVHEAGHAVAAARLDIGFVHVSVMPPKNRTKMGDGFFGGGLQLTRFENGWAADRIDDAFEMCMMGVTAEEKILHDSIKGGFREDIMQFRRAANYLDGLSETDYLPLHKRVMAKIDDNWPQIERDIRTVVRAFAKQFTASGAQLMSNLEEPLLLTSSEVHAILDAVDLQVLN